MAIGTTLRGKYAGKLGEDVFYVRNGEQIVRSYVPGSMQRNPKTEQQMQFRVRWANVLNVYKSFNGTLKDCFEAKQNRQSDYNRFMSINLQSVPVFLTRTFVEQGACVAAPYLISQGSLPEISVTGTDETAYTNIRLGDLTITATTTIAEFAKAVVDHNPGFEYYDQLSYYSVLQMMSTEGIPFVRCTQTRINLNPTDDTALLDIAPSYGFSTNNGFLGHGEYVGQGAFCWVQSRNSYGRVLVSSQRLVANNDLLAQYTTPQAEAAAMRSYGVQPGAFIRPDQQSGGSGNTTVVTVPPTVTIYNIDGTVRTANSETFALGTSVSILLTGNNLDHITSLQLIYGNSISVEGDSRIEAVIDESTTPTTLKATATVPAGSFCYGMTANGGRIIEFSATTPDPDPAA